MTTPRCKLRALVLLILISPVTAADADGALRGRAAINFQATSTLHNFSGSGEATEFTLQPAGDQYWSADVELPVSSLDTGNSWRDDDMREMLHAARCPAIRARFERVDPVAASRESRLPFVLTICEVTQPIVAKLHGWQQSADTLSFEADFDVSLQAFHLEAPRTLFVSVADSVRVSVKAHVRRE